jgi:membrane protease YdiL (CAAX protease family)
MAIIALFVVLFFPSLSSKMIQVEALDAFGTQVSLLLVLLISCKLFPIDPEILNLKINIKKLIVFILIGCGLFAMTVIVMNLIGNKLPQFHHILIVRIISIIACITAPVIEELFYRGIIFDNLVKRYSFWISAIYSSMLFAIAHISLIKLIPMFIIGIVLCWILNKERKIIYCIAIHLLINIFSEISYYL